MALTPNDKVIIEYLRVRDWTSPTRIGRDVWGEGHHSASASPVCLKLVRCGLLERNDKGWYRLSEQAK